MSHSSRQRAPAKRQQDSVDAIKFVEQFEPDCARAFACVQVFAVLYEKRVPLICDLAGAGSCILDIALNEFDARSELANSVDLRCIRAGAGDHGNFDAAPSPAVGQSLSEIAGAGADRGLWTEISRNPRRHDLSSSALETPDRIGGFELDNKLATEQIAKWGADKLRRVAKLWRDLLLCGLNA